MSLLNIYTRQAPTLAGYAFDAVLEDNFEASVEMTTYPLESGIRVSDHRIIQPMRWSMVGAVSNNPLKPLITDFLGGVVSNYVDNSMVASVSGLSAGFLAGSDETRSSTTLQFLITLMQTGEPFDVDAGDIFLRNMIITKLSRSKDPATEGGLIFVADLQELILMERLAASGDPSADQLRDGDVSKSAVSRKVSKGQVDTPEPTSATRATVNDILDFGGIA